MNTALQQRPPSSETLQERAEAADAHCRREKRLLAQKEGLLRDLCGLEARYTEITSRQCWSSMRLFEAHQHLEAEIKDQQQRVLKAENRRFFSFREAGLDPAQELPPKAPEPL